MISLKWWFLKRTQVPLVIAMVIVIISQVILLYHSNQQNLTKQTEITEYLSAVVSSAITNKNRNLVEQTLAIAFKGMHAHVILLCKGNQTIIHSGEEFIFCNQIDRAQGVFKRVISRPLIGLADYQLYYVLPKFSDLDHIIFVFCIALGCVITFMAILFYIQKKLFSNLIKPLMELSGPLSLSRTSDIQRSSKDSNIKELNEIVKQQENILKLEKQAAIGKVVRQVVHDIRSPLSALNMMIIQNIHELPEEKRIIIRQQIDRIQDIANHLLIKNNCQTDSKEITPQLLSSAIEEILTEKRLNFRAYLGLTIEGDIYNPSNYGLFAKINLVEFKRVISNLINNSVEAMPERQGKVVVKLIAFSEELVQIIVTDNGKGIPAEIAEKIGKEGVSFGKENNKQSGYGLGLYHAQTTIQGWGGKLNIISEEGQGTEIIISLQKAPTPEWFAPVILLSPSECIVILDDDIGIHKTWENRFRNLKTDSSSNLHSNPDPNGNYLKLFHFSNPNDFRKWSKQESHIYSHILYLSDYELLGMKESGLDLLEELIFTSSPSKDYTSILVTSHYENELIRKRCNKLRVKLIPKMLAGFVPLEYKKVSEKHYPRDEISHHNLPFPSNSQPFIYEYVYIDDDKWHRLGWETYAKRKNIKLLTLHTARAFYQYTEQISKEHSHIYIDSDLGENQIKGEEFAQILYADGYRKLYLATAYDSEYFPNLTGIKYSGKECPFGTD